MALTDDLSALEQMHQRGALNDTEFAQAKAKLLASSGLQPTTVVTSVNGLRRSLHDRWLGGVCGGLAAATGVESWLLRLLVVLAVCLGGVGIVLYLLAWIFIPLESDQRLLPSPR